MKKKRLAFLLSFLCAVNVVLPANQLFAAEVEEEVRSTIEVVIEGETDKTTDGQIEVEKPGEVTTPSAIDVTELKELIAKAEELSADAVVGTAPGCYDELDKLIFDEKIALAKEALEKVTTQEELQTAIDSLNKAIVVFKESVIAEEHELDRTTADTLIVEAQTLLQETTTGSAIGQCPESAKIALEIAVIKAERGLAVAQTQNDINNIVRDLEVAIKAFKNSLVKPEDEDTNADGAINVADLALVAYYYGESNAGDNWGQAQKADVNNDGQVNIDDLTIIASRMLG